MLTVFAELAMGKIDGKTLNQFFSKSAGQISFVGSVVEKRTINRFLAVPSLNFAYFLRIRRKRVELAIFVGFALENSFTVYSRDLAKRPLRQTTLSPIIVVYQPIIVIACCRL